MGKKVKDVNTEKREKRETLFWTTHMDDALIQAMIKEQDKGNRPDGTFTPLAYTNMVEELSINLTNHVNKNHLKNRLKTLKKHFSQCYDVFHGSGVSWNPVTKLFEAEEQVWEELIANKPDAAIWKTKTVSNYNELHELFAKDKATGVVVGTPKEKRKGTNNDDARIESIDEIDHFLSTNEINNLENFNVGDNIQVRSTSPSQKNSQTSKKKKVEEQSEIVSKIMSSLEYVVDAIKECTKAIVGSRPPTYTEHEIFNELALMGVGEDVIPKAYLLLVRSPENTRALFACPPLMRMAVLKEMMGTHDSRS